MIALIGPVLSGLLYGLSFPPFNLHFLAWIALVPLLVSRPGSLREQFTKGLVAGFIANLMIFFWLWKTFMAAHVGIVTTLACWTSLSLLLAIYFGIFSLKIFSPWIMALLWVALEAVRSHILTGFPWALFAHTQAYNRPILQFAATAGTQGISFLLVAANVAIAAAWTRRRRVDFVNLGAVLLAVIGLFFWGRKRIEALSMPSTSFKVAILQGNIDQYQKWDESYEAGIRKRYEDLVSEAAASKPDLIVWPESSVPGWFPNQLPYVTWVKSLALKADTPQLIGAVTAHGEKEFNAAFLIDKEGRIAGEYDKRHLVPFGEFIPFGGFLKRWIPYLGQLGTFNSGETTEIFNVKGVKVSPNICYEAIFPRLIHSSGAHGADVIVNITNDGWFLDTAAPEQHFVANIFRAVETGLPVVRAANTGISAVIDATGREIIRSPLLVTGVFTAEVPLLHVDTIISVLYSRLCREN